MVQEAKVRCERTMLGKKKPKHAKPKEKKAKKQEPVNRRDKQKDPFKGISRADAKKAEKAAKAQERRDKVTKNAAERRGGTNIT